MPTQKQIEILAKGLANQRGWLFWTEKECAENEEKAHENKLLLNIATGLAEAYEEAGWNYNMEEAPRDGTYIDLNVPGFERTLEASWDKTVGCWLTEIGCFEHDSMTEMGQPCPTAWRERHRPPAPKEER